MNKESPWYGESWIVLYADDIDDNLSSPFPKLH